MAPEYLDYYATIADRILPFLQGRQIAIEQRFPRTKGIVYRRHTGGSGDDTLNGAGGEDMHQRFAVRVRWYICLLAVHEDPRWLRGWPEMDERIASWDGVPQPLPFNVSR